MVITFTNGTITTTTSEVDIFDITADNHFSAWVFLHNMTSAETIQFIIYVLDANASVMRKYDTVALTGVQSNPAWLVPYVPAKEYKVSIQKTAGSNIAVTWLRGQVT